MDIKIPPESSASGKSVSQPAGDLLTQLRAAGTVTAEVLRVAPGEVLLSSRLGNILASNSLNYKAGDRLDIQLGGSEQKPVLRVSPARIATLSIEPRQAPALSQVLTSAQPVLARFVRAYAQTTEIKLADKLLQLQLPQPLKLVKNQLLSLQRNDKLGKIEITPLDNKLLFKALLKQLIPQQAGSHSSGLIKLLSLANLAVQRTQVASQSTASAMAPEVADPPRRFNASTPPQHAVTTATARQSKPTAAADQELSSVPLRKLPSTTDATQTRKPTAGELLKATTKIANRVIGTISKPAAGDKPTVSNAPVATSATAAKLPAQTGIARPTSNSADAGKQPPQTSLAALKNLSNSPPPAQAASNLQTEPTKTSPGPPGPAPDSGRQTIPSQRRSTSSSQSPNMPELPVAASARQSSAEALKPASTAPASVELPKPASSQQSAANAPKPPAASPEPPQSPLTKLQLLSRLVIKLPSISATHIKQWFELLNLTATPKAAGEPQWGTFKILQQLSDREVFSRELLQLVRNHQPQTGNNEVQTGRQTAPEALRQQIFDGAKLAEQSVSQNLLQRSSLGLQLETQQPLNLSLALPFLDQNQVKPLSIDLAQRNQSEQQESREWDIRLSFELADLGPISVHLVMAGSTVAASFYSVQNDTRERIEAALPGLRQQLAQAGFISGEMQSFPGVAAASQITPTMAYAESLIDIEA